MHPKKRNSITSLLFWILFISFLISTSPVYGAKKVTIKIPKEKKEEVKPPSEPPPKPEKAEPGVIEGETRTEEIKKEGYSYDPSDKVDPFKPFVVIKKVEKEVETETREPKTYLESLEISQLTVSSIILSEDKGNWAMVRDSKGEGHVINVGTPIGRKGGKVVKILKDEVVVKEYYRDFRGNEVPNFVSMKLPSVD